MRSGDRRDMSLWRTLATIALLVCGLAGARDDGVVGIAAPRVETPPESPLAEAAKVGDVTRVRVLYPEATMGQRHRALWNAVLGDRFEVLQALFDLGIRDNPPQFGLEDALYLAAVQSHVHAIQLLCANGADPNYTHDAEQRTALHGALLPYEFEHDYVGTANALLDCGARPSDRFKDDTYKGITTRHTIPAIIDAAHTGDVALAQRMLGYGLDINARSRPGGRNALFQDALDTDMAKFLLARGIDAKLLDDDGVSAVTHAACHPGPQTAEVVHLLVEAGSPVNTADSWWQSHGATALHCAAKFGNIEAVRALLDAGADPNRRDKNAHTVLGLIAEIDGEPNLRHNAYLLSGIRGEDNHRAALVTIVTLLGEHGADPSLDPKAAEQAQESGAVAGALRSISQSQYLRDAAACMARRASAEPRLARPSPRARAPKQDRFTLARVTVLNNAGPISPWFTVSPDGRWLVSTNDGDGNTESPDVRVYDLAQDRGYALRLHQPTSPEGAGWSSDSRAIRFRVDFGEYDSIDLSGTEPRVSKPADFVPSPRAGGDGCDARSERDELQGEPEPWSHDGQNDLRNPLDGTQYELDHSAPDRDVLVAVKGAKREVLIEHARGWLVTALLRESDRALADFLKHFPDDKHKRLVPPAPERTRKARELASAAKLDFYNLQLSPSSQYLYYAIGQRYPSSPFSRRFVADLLARPVHVWEIVEPVVSAQWHPDGRDLLLRLEEPHQESEDPRADLGRLAVARFR